MWRTAQIVEFPTPSLPALAALAAAFIGFFSFAYLIELRRRRAVERKHRDSDWKHIERLMTECRLSDGEQKLLRDAIRRFSRDNPLDAVMTHSGYERLVEQAMAHFAKKHSEQEVREYGIALRDIRIQLGLERVPMGQSIHTTREIDPGQWLDVRIDGTWVRMMADVVDEAVLYLAYKGEEPAPRMPAPGDTAHCRFWREDDGRYVFETRVLGTERMPPLILLEHTAELSRTQDRDYFRVRHDQSTTLGVLSAKLAADPEEARKRPPVTRLRGRITSLSAGGCAVVTQQSVSKRMLLKVLLDLPDASSMELLAKIVSSTQISGERHFLRLEFVHMEETEQDAIAKYVMQRQQQALAP